VQKQMEQKIIFIEIGAVTLLKRRTAPNRWSGNYTVFTIPATNNYIAAQENTTSMIDTFCLYHSSCGSWVSPAIQILSSRVDAI